MKNKENQMINLIKVEIIKWKKPFYVILIPCSGGGMTSKWN